mmetsp:Transcript_31906/g.51797  ORF Transcript_31906/g.51797 Transcript_31906/m.51797 type:complete len:475 (+) Transcript_31906:90-1514(+)
MGACSSNKVDDDRIETTNMKVYRPSGVPPPLPRTKRDEKNITPLDVDGDEVNVVKLRDFLKTNGQQRSCFSSSSSSTPSMTTPLQHYVYQQHNDSEDQKGNSERRERYEEIVRCISLLEEVYSCVEPADKRAREVDRTAASRAGTQLTYGEISPYGVEVMMDSFHMNARQATAMVDIGCGAGKLAIQCFEQFPNLKHVIGIEISRDRFRLCRTALGRYAKILEKQKTKRILCKIDTDLLHSHDNRVLKTLDLVTINNDDEDDDPYYVHDEELKIGALMASEKKDQYDEEEGNHESKSLPQQHLPQYRQPTSKRSKEKIMKKNKKKQRSGKAKKDFDLSQRCLEFHCQDVGCLAAKIAEVEPTVVIMDVAFLDMPVALGRVLMSLPLGARVLSYENIRRKWPLSFFPFVEINKGHHYPTSWQAGVGHIFFTWVKCLPAANEPTSRRKKTAAFAARRGRSWPATRSNDDINCDYTA